MSPRMNVRNYLAGLSISEIRTVLEGVVERGETARADFTAEYLREVEEEENGVRDWAIPLTYF